MLFTRRQLIHFTLGGGVALALLPLATACGQPAPTPGAAGAAPLVATPLLEATPGTPGTPPNIPLTATAVARVPTMSGPTVAAPPPVTGTVVYPTQAPTQPVPTLAQPQVYATLRPEDPVRLGVSGNRTRDVPFLIANSTMTVLGTAVAVLPAQWSTDDGQRPPNPHLPPSESPYAIFRPVQFRVEQVLAGQTVEGDLMLYAFGGVVGQDSMRYLSDNSYNCFQGERAVLFLQFPLPSVPGQWRRQTLWSIVDHYTVTESGQAKASFRTIPLQQLLDEIAGTQR